MLFCFQFCINDNEDHNCIQPLESMNKYSLEILTSKLSCFNL